MKYRRLGTTGLLVSEVSFGAMTFGDDPWRLGGLEQGQADRLVSRCLEAGVNLFDTADVYARGESETLLGRALGPRRNDVVLATKVRGRTGDGPNAVGLSRAHVIASVEESLRRLDTDWIDLYQLHGWDSITPIEETLSALTDLVRQGKVRYIGMSNFAAWQMARSEGVAALRGFERFVSAQMFYSLVGRDLEDEVVPYCVSAGVGILVWSPLAGGFLSGKYRRDTDTPPEGSRWATTGSEFPPFDRERGWRILEVVREIAGARGLTASQVALAWLLARPGVTSVILGARRREQLAEDLEAAEVVLEPDELKRLDEVSRPPARYPRWMIDSQAARRNPAG